MAPKPSQGGDGSSKNARKNERRRLGNRISVEDRADQSSDSGAWGIASGNSDFEPLPSPLLRSQWTPSRQVSANASPNVPSFALEPADNLEELVLLELDSGPLDGDSALGSPFPSVLGGAEEKGAAIASPKAGASTQKKKSKKKG